MEKKDSKRLPRHLKLYGIIIFFGGVLFFAYSSIANIAKVGELTELQRRCEDGELAASSDTIKPGVLWVPDEYVNLGEGVEISTAARKAEAIYCVETNDFKTIKTCGPYSLMGWDFDFEFIGGRPLLVDVESESIIASGKIIWPEEYYSFSCPSSVTLGSTKMYFRGSSDTRIYDSILELYVKNR